MPSVREIAKLAGVSISTVSRALNNDPAVRDVTRRKVLDTANKFGFAASVGRRVTTNIGLAYTDKETAGSTFDSAVLHGVLRGLDQSRFDVVILDVHRDKTSDETYSQFFIRKGVRGVLVRATRSSRQICKEIADEGFPSIVLCERFDEPDVSFVGCDSRAESVSAIEYLLSLGHRRIAFGMHSVPDYDHLDRLEGYKEALQRRNVDVDQRLILKLSANLAGGSTAIKMLLSMAQPPTAVFFADPLLTVGAINTAHEMGVRVPGDIAVVGFDDADMRHSTYPTTTAVCQDAGQLGFEAATGLMRMVLNGSREPLRRVLPTFFEVNQSTGPPADTPTRILANGVRKPTASAEMGGS